MLDRLSVGLIAGLVLATIALLAVGLVDARLAPVGSPPGVPRAQIAFFATWLLVFLVSPFRLPAIGWVRVWTLAAGVLLLLLPLEWALLFGWSRATSGTFGRVNTGLLIAGAVVVAVGWRVRPRDSADRLAPRGTSSTMPARRDLSRAHVATAIIGAVATALASAAAAGAVTPGDPIEGVAAGVLIAPPVWVASLLYGLLATDATRCLVRSAALVAGVAILASLLLALG